MSDTQDAHTGRGFWSLPRLALAALAFALGVFVVSTARRTTPTPPADLAEPLPHAVADATIRALEGDSFKLSDYKGRIVVLDIWATWCGPCREEIPHLVGLSTEYGPRGVDVIGLSIEDPSSDEGLVRDFAQEYDINYKLGWADVRDEWFSSLTRGVETIPQTFVIGRDGRLYLHHSGFSKDTPQILRDAIDRAENSGRVD